MPERKSILFVCTGNIFRSLSAELSFKKYLADNGIDGWDVSSAGTIATTEPVDPKTIETLEELGLDASEHRQKKLTRGMLETYDVIVGMAEDHLEFMRSTFNYNTAFLFNELAIGEKTSVRDIDEVPDHKTNRPEVEKKIERTVREIYGKTPALFTAVSERFYPSRT